MYRAIGGLSFLSLSSISLWIVSSSEYQLEGYFNQFNDFLWSHDPNPQGSLSKKVLIKLFEGMKDTPQNDTVCCLLTINHLIILMLLVE